MYRSAAGRRKKLLVVCLSAIATAVLLSRIKESQTHRTHLSRQTKFVLHGVRLATVTSLTGKNYYLRFVSRHLPILSSIQFFDLYRIHV